MQSLKDVLLLGDEDACEVAQRVKYCAPVGKDIKLEVQDADMSTTLGAVQQHALRPGNDRNGLPKPAANTHCNLKALALAAALACKVPLAAHRNAAVNTYLWRSSFPGVPIKVRSKNIDLQALMTNAGTKLSEQSPFGKAVPSTEAVYLAAQVAADTFAQRLGVDSCGLSSSAAPKAADFAAVLNAGNVVVPCDATVPEPVRAALREALGNAFKEVTDVDTTAAPASTAAQQDEAVDAKRSTNKRKQLPPSLKPQQPPGGEKQKQQPSQQQPPGGKKQKKQQSQQPQPEGWAQEKPPRQQPRCSDRGGGSFKGKAAVKPKAEPAAKAAAADSHSDSDSMPSVADIARDNSVMELKRLLRSENVTITTTYNNATSGNKKALWWLADKWHDHLGRGDMSDDSEQDEDGEQDADEDRE